MPIQFKSAELLERGLFLKTLKYLLFFGETLPHITTLSINSTIGWCQMKNQEIPVKRKAGSSLRTAGLSNR